MKCTQSLPLLSLLGGLQAAAALAARPSTTATSTIVNHRASPLARRDYTSNTANELTDGTECRAVTVIYARGTGQSGNIGATTDVGPMFLNDLGAITGFDNLAVQGVTYAASVGGFLAGGDAAGSQKLADLAEQALTQCPDTLLVLSGYSQGAQLVGKAGGLVSADVTDFIAAVVMFGVPDYFVDGDTVGSVPASKVHTICHSNDGICQGTGVPTAGHLNYQDDADEAALWLAEFLGYSA